MLQGLKPLFNRLLNPLVHPLVRIGIGPNHCTLAGLALSAVSGWLVYKRSWTAAFIVLIAGALLDGLDGVVARQGKRASVFGAILDSSCDRLAEMFIMAGLLGYFLTAPLLSFSGNHLSLRQRAWGIVFCYTAITLSLMVSYIKARCEGTGVACKGGILQRPERIILLSVGLCLGPRAMVWVLGSISLLAAITVVQRFIEAYAGAKRVKGEG